MFTSDDSFFPGLASGSDPGRGVDTGHKSIYWIKTFKGQVYTIHYLHSSNLDDIIEINHPTS